MPTNRIRSQFAEPILPQSPGQMLACVAPAGLVVMIAAPQELVALHQQLYQAAQERARRDLAPPSHYRLLSNWN